jgi:hypothetical protein
LITNSANNIKSMNKISQPTAKEIFKKTATPKLSGFLPNKVSAWKYYQERNG